MFIVRILSKIGCKIDDSLLHYEDEVLANQRMEKAVNAGYTAQLFTLKSQMYSKSEVVKEEYHG